MTQSATVTVDAKASAHSAAAPAAAKPAAAPAARPAAEASPGIDWRELIGQRIIPPILGFALFIAVGRRWRKSPRAFLARPRRLWRQ